MEEKPEMQNRSPQELRELSRLMRQRMEEFERQLGLYVENVARLTENADRLLAAIREVTADMEEQIQEARRAILRSRARLDGGGDSLPAGEFSVAARESPPSPEPPQD